MLCNIETLNSFGESKGIKKEHNDDVVSFFVLIKLYTTLA